MVFGCQSMVHMMADNPCKRKLHGKGVQRGFSPCKIQNSDSDFGILQYNPSVKKGQSNLIVQESKGDMQN